MPARGKAASPKGRSGSNKKAKAAATGSLVEDLDLDVSAMFREEAEAAKLRDDDVEDDLYSGDEDERRIVKNARQYDSHDALDVLPSEAHKVDDEYDADRREHGVIREEGELAAATARKRRTGMADDDFDIGGISASVAAGVKKTAKSSAAASSANNSALVEKVERDFAAISSTERLQLLRKESPEVLKLAEEFATHMTQLKALTGPVHELLHGAKVRADQQHLVSFLETKVQLMISYCMHICFYLLLKVEGQKVKNHPVVDRLVELRTYMEKMWPLEQKLQYSINTLLNSKQAFAARTKDIRAVEESNSRTLQKAIAGDEKKREARKNLKIMRDAEDDEAEQQNIMSRGAQKKQQKLTMDVSEIEQHVGGNAYREAEDQFFSKLTAGDDDSGIGGGSLLDKLRSRVGKNQEAIKSAKQSNVGKKSKAYHDDEEDDEDRFDEGEAMRMGEDDEEDFDLLGEDDEEFEEGDFDDDEEDLFDELEAEDRAAEAEEEERKAATSTAPRPDREVKRRQITNKIETHRGLTKARPKDRKNPRTNQRRKYERGMRSANAQSRQAHKEAPENYVGMPAMKTHVTHSTKFQ